MPELPEVETVKRVLKSQLLNKEIKDIKIYYSQIFENIEDSSKLINDSFIDILRKGKYLIFVTNKGYLVSHLRMEGKFFYIKENDDFFNKHIHLTITFNDNNKLMYQDVRKFGRFHYFNTYDEVINYMHLGPDANSDINVNDFYNILKKKKKDIKTILLDQNIIAGLGNIYVDEVLYASKLDPKLPANLLDYDDAFNILTNSKKILDRAIECRGTTIRSYTSSLGVTGGYQNYLSVHTKKNCPHGHKVYKTVVGGRGTYYCPICQDKHQKMVIGITGGIACGKSTMKAYLESLGFYVSDSDYYVKEAYKDESILNKLITNFPSCYINDKIDPKVLGNIVFNDKDKLALLNSIIHPYVINRLKEDISKHNILFLDIPLLYEAKLEYLCDKVVCLYVDLDTQISRIMGRDGRTYQEASNIINSQLSLEYKKNKANYTINTSGSINDTHYLIDNLITYLLEDR